MKPKAHKGQQLPPDDKESSLSPGALAGAGCAVLFLVVVAGFTIMNIYTAPDKFNKNWLCCFKKSSFGYKLQKYIT
jgi:hypothetical protein